MKVSDNKATAEGSLEESFPLCAKRGRSWARFTASASSEPSLEIMHEDHYKYSFIFANFFLFIFTLLSSFSSTPLPNSILYSFSETRRRKTTMSHHFYRISDEKVNEYHGARAHFMERPIKTLSPIHYVCPPAFREVPPKLRNPQSNTNKQLITIKWGLIYQASLPSPYWVSLPTWPHWVTWVMQLRKNNLKLISLSCL